MKFNFSFKNRKLPFYLSFGLGIISLLIAIVLLVIDLVMIRGKVSYDDRNVLTFVFILLSALASLFYAFTEIEIVPIASAILLAVGIGNHLNLAMFPYADIGTSVPFFTSAELVGPVSTYYTLFLILMVIVWIAQLVLTFFGKGKEKTEESQAA